jgi:hypothetical protein
MNWQISSLKKLDGAFCPATTNGFIPLKELECSGSSHYTERMKNKNTLAAVAAIAITIALVCFITPKIWFCFMVCVLAYLIWAMIVALID